MTKDGRALPNAKLADLHDLGGVSRGKKLSLDRVEA